jgi:tRNA U34 5-carboxymethylaminomethyl modifying enzyme MnmG/GidA
LGLIEPTRWKAWARREQQLEMIRKIFAADNERISREARRQDTPLKDIERLCRHDAECPDEPALLERVLTEVRYEGYIERQHRDVARQKREESVLIPADLDPAGIQGLRHEARDALLRYRPGTLGQAGRIEGITPSDLTLVAIAIKRRSRSH